VRGQAVAMALLALTGGLGSLAEITRGTADEPHAPITIDGDGELRTNACACIRNPGASGTPTDPFIIEDWRIQTSGTAIVIQNIADEHFIVRDNHLQGDAGLVLSNTGDRGTVVDNVIDFASTGIDLENSSPFVASNDVRGTNNDYQDGTLGIGIDGGSPTLDDNFVTLAHHGIWAEASSPKITNNNVTAVYDGIRLSEATQARLVNNNVSLADRWGVHVEDSAHARLISNSISEGMGGIVVDSAKLYMQDNEVTNQKRDAIAFERSTVQMFRNTIANNWRGAFGSTNSEVLIKDNVFRDNGDEAGPNNNEGLRLEGSEGRVVNNTLVGNDVGIRLSHSIITLEDNVLNDNRWGMSVPYDSKGSIPLMQGNFIDGVNVDGTVNPDEQRIFYEEVGVNVTDEEIVAGQRDDGFGSLFLQGSVVVYDSKDVTIENNTFQYNDVAVHVEQSAFVRVRDNAFLSNNEAVVSVDSRTFVKDNICDIEIDPPETVCVEADGGFVTVRANVFAHVAVGAEFRGGAEGVIVDNSIRSTTEAGLVLKGSFDQGRHDVEVLNNDIESNLVGAVLVHFQGTIEANTFAENDKAGVHLDKRTDARFEGNVIVDNSGDGIADVSGCHYTSRPQCATGVFVDNRFEGNAEAGVHLKGGGSFESDVFVRNEIGADVDGRVEMTNVNASKNAEIGIHAEGSLTLEESVVVDNEIGVDVAGELHAEDVRASFNDETGIQASGTTRLETVFARNNSEDGVNLRGEARVEEGNFSGNGEAGMRLGGTLFIVEDCEASFNADGVVVVSGDVDVDLQVPVPEPPSVGVPQPPGDDDDDDPLWMHECDIVGNEDFGLRANVEARVNATHNFWGKQGPVVDTPVFPGDNTVSSNARVTPFYETRDHETLCTIPATETSADTPKGCLEA